MKKTGKFQLPEGLVMPIFFGPSGSGKTTIVRYLIEQIPELSLSVSDTTREVRDGEIDGVHYYFREEEGFRNLINAEAFLEWEQVYPGKLYGTRFAEIIRLYNQKKVPIFDIDVKGAKTLVTTYPKNFVPIMIHTDIENLRIRLIGRGTELPKDLASRLGKALSEYDEGFSFISNENIVYNEVLEKAQQKAYQIVKRIMSETLDPHQ